MNSSAPGVTRTRGLRFRKPSLYPAELREQSATTVPDDASKIKCRWGKLRIMPTYTCTAAEGLLDADRKGRIAEAITSAHAEVTGAPRHFAQVIFNEVRAGDHFVGGAPLGHRHVFVYGRIRAGRSAVERGALVKRLVADVARAAGLTPFAVWVYLLELPARAMAEFGHVLPEPGDEPAWTAALPDGDRELMERIGRR
jgi:phenylpyruvate tautomerase PptA (4-oxalocrotonate tautomerase family)